MPSVVVSDIASARLSTISFFLFTIIISTILFKYTWNSLGKTFEKLPKLTLKQSALFITILTLFISLILVMISGARELLTPGAWEKVPNKSTYRLKSPNDK